MEYIKIGVIVNTHGLKGELKIKSFSDFDDVRYALNQQLYISYHNEMIPVVVAKTRAQKGMMIVAFNDLEDINLVEKYRNCEIFIDKEDRHDLEEDEVYFSDLIDCEVYLEDGTLLGNVEDVLETGANAVLRVNKKILIPFVHSFVKECDIANKKIVIYPVEGLL